MLKPLARMFPVGFQVAFVLAVGCRYYLLFIYFFFFTATACSKLLFSARASAAPLLGPLGSTLDTIPLPHQAPLTYAYCGLQTIATIALLFRVIYEFLKSSSSQELSHRP